MNVSFKSAAFAIMFVHKSLAVVTEVEPMTILGRVLPIHESSKEIVFGFELPITRLNFEKKGAEAERIVDSHYFGVVIYNVVSHGFISPAKLKMSNIMEIGKTLIYNLQLCEPLQLHLKVMNLGFEQPLCGQIAINHFNSQTLLALGYKSVVIDLDVSAPSISFLPSVENNKKAKRKVWSKHSHFMYTVESFKVGCIAFTSAAAAYNQKVSFNPSVSLTRAPQGQKALVSEIYNRLGPSVNELNSNYYENRVSCINDKTDIKISPDELIFTMSSLSIKIFDNYCIFAIEMHSTKSDVWVLGAHMLRNYSLTLSLMDGSLEIGKVMSSTKQAQGNISEDQPRSKKPKLH